MKQFDEKGLELCKIQANLFALSVNKANGSSYLFIRRYMNSKVCEKMDNLTYLFEKNDVFYELQGKDVNGIKLSQDILYWIGYIYRYWAYTYELSSKEIYRIISGKEMSDLYGPYHTMDPNAAIERIYEYKNIDKQQSQIDILRKNYKKNEVI